MIARAAMMAAGMAAMVAMTLSSITSQRGGGEYMVVGFRATGAISEGRTAR